MSIDKKVPLRQATICCVCRKMLQQFYNAADNIIVGRILLYGCHNADTLRHLHCHPVGRIGGQCPNPALILSKTVEKLHLTITGKKPPPAITPQSKNLSPVIDFPSRAKNLSPAIDSPQKKEVRKAVSRLCGLLFSPHRFKALRASFFTQYFNNRGIFSSTPPGRTPVQSVSFYPE